MLSTKHLRQLRESSPSGGNRVGLALELSGLTQMELAAAVGLTQPYISDVARNRYQDISVQNARKFAEFFGCSIEDLFPARQQTAVAS